MTIIGVVVGPNMSGACEGIERAISFVLMALSLCLGPMSESGRWRLGHRQHLMMSGMWSREGRRLDTPVRSAKKPWPGTGARPKQRPVMMKTCQHGEEKWV